MFDLVAPFVIPTACTGSLFALLAGAAGQWLTASERFAHIQRYLTGGVFLALGLNMAPAGIHGTHKN